MNKNSVKKIIGLIALLAIICFGIGTAFQAHAAADTANNGSNSLGTLTPGTGCSSASAQFDLGSSALDALLDSPNITKSNTPLVNFYTSSSQPLVSILVNAPSCGGSTITVSLSAYDPVSDSAVSALDQKAFIVPSSGQFQINMIAGTDYCGQTQGLYGGPQCLYVLDIYSNGNDIYYSSGKPRGDLGYNLPAGTVSQSGLFGASWAYSSDTSANQTNKNSVSLQNAGTTDSCTGQVDCYQLSSGLSGLFSALGIKLSVLTQTTSLGQFLNAIIEIIIGIAGVILVVRIMYIGVIYMRTDNVTKELTVHKAIAQAVGGFILLLLIYTLLRTINPDLLNLTPSIQNQLIQIQNNSPTNPADKKTDESQAVIVSPGITGFATDPKTNISQYDKFFSASADPKGVDCTLMKADMYIESGGNPNAVSSATARGLMQIMPAVAQTFNVSFDSMFDPATNIETSSKLWQYNYQAGCNGASSNSVCNTSNIQYVIAANSAGAGSNQPSSTCPGQTQWQCSANAGYQETREYIPKVTNAYNILKQNGWGCQ